MINFLNKCHVNNYQKIMTIMFYLFLFILKYSLYCKFLLIFILFYNNKFKQKIVEWNTKMFSPIFWLIIFYKYGITFYMIIFLLRNNLKYINNLRISIFILILYDIMILIPTRITSIYMCFYNIYHINDICISIKNICKITLNNDKILFNRISIIPINEIYEIKIINKSFLYWLFFSAILISLLN